MGLDLNFFEFGEETVNLKLKPMVQRRPNLKINIGVGSTNNKQRVFILRVLKTTRSSNMF